VVAGGTVGACWSAADVHNCCAGSSLTAGDAPAGSGRVRRHRQRDPVPTADDVGWRRAVRVPRGPTDSDDRAGARDSRTGDRGAELLLTREDDQVEDARDMTYPRPQRRFVRSTLSLQPGRQPAPRPCRGGCLRRGHGEPLPAELQLEVAPEAADQPLGPRVGFSLPGARRVRLGGAEEASRVVRRSSPGSIRRRPARWSRGSPARRPDQR
jgi:hypothetical protein